MFRWEPQNLTACAFQTPHAQIPVCSSFGLFYLSFLAHLFDDTRKPPSLPNPYIKDDFKYSDKIVKDIKGFEERFGEEEEFDFIVVGAGSAGCVVANRLTEVDKWKVLLLEAGPDEPSIALVPGLNEALLGSNVDWSYPVASNGKSCLSLINGRCVWPRGKMMGGTSSINTLVLSRGNPLDFDTWAAAGNRGWDYNQVLHYYKKSEKNLNVEVLDPKHHGSSGPQFISRFPYIDEPSILLTEAFNQLGLPIVDINGVQQLGTQQTQAFSMHGYRTSANNAYIDPIRRKRKNLTVRTLATVNKILIDQNKRAYGVEYTRKGKSYTVKAKKEVIVSGGTVASPKLLLLSGIGPKEDLEQMNIPVVQHLPVGFNLHDHVTFGGLLIKLDNETSTMVSGKEMLEMIEEYVAMEYKHGPLSSTGSYNSVSYYKTDKNLPAPDIQIQTQNSYWRAAYSDYPVLQSVRILPTGFYDAIQVRVQNVVPKSRGWLKLNASNPNGDPIIYPNYLSKYDDIVTVQKGVKILLGLEKTEPFKSGRFSFIKKPLQACEHTIWGSDEYVECMMRHYTFILSHMVGTCKMGAEWDDTAVVDPRLRVYGVSGLRVIDGSIMPVVPRSNTNAPCIMIGEKGADMIKEDWLHNYVPDFKHGVKPSD